MFSVSSIRLKGSCRPVELKGRNDERGKRYFLWQLCCLEGLLHILELKQGYVFEKVTFGKHGLKATLRKIMRLW